MRFSHSQTMGVADFKIPAHLRAMFVMPTLPCFQIQPNTWLTDIDVGQSVNVNIDLFLELLRQARPTGVVAVAKKLRVANRHTADATVVTIQDWERIQVSSKRLRRRYFTCYSIRKIDGWPHGMGDCQSGRQTRCRPNRFQFSPPAAGQPHPSICCRSAERCKIFR